MNREILSEINRVREIMGVKLISEAPVNPKWFVSNTADEIMSTLLDINPNFKGTLDDVTDIMSRDIDEIYDPFLREFRQSIDEVMQSQGKSIDDILANQNLRKIVEGKFLSKVKSSSDLLDDFIEEYYVANPAARKLSDPKVISNVVKKASEGGIKNLDNVETVLFKTVDDFVTEDGKKIPEVIKKGIKDAISSSVTGSTTKKVSDAAVEATIDNIILTAPGINPKIANKLKSDKNWRNQVKQLLLKHNNDVNKVNSEFKNNVTQFIKQQTKDGKTEEELFNSVVSYTNKFFGIEPVKQLLWKDGAGFFENLQRILVTIGIPTAAFAVNYLWWDGWMNTQDSEFIKQIRTKFSYLPTTLRKDYFNYIVQKLGGEDKAKTILLNPNVSYKWDVYDGQDYITETEYLTTISLDGKELKFTSDNEGENPELLENTFEASAGGKQYNQTLDDFKKFLTDNGLGVNDVKNDTESSGFWKANGKDYSYDVNTKTFVEA
jgi:hypothetical protein